MRICEHFSFFSRYSENFYQNIFAIGRAKTMLNQICESTWKTDFVGLFTNTTSIICLVCLAIGLVLLAIECFIPGFGVFGITGVVFCAFSFLYLIIADGSWIKVLYMFAIALVVMAIVIVIAVRSARFGVLSRSPLVQNGTDLPEDYSKNEKNYSYLVGKTGMVKTICKPAGKVEIDGQTYTVITSGEYIPRDKMVVVSDVDGATIVVKEIESEKKERK